MKKQDLSAWNCSVARTADLIGDWWMPMLLRDASRGVDTFDGFHDSLGISRNTLTQRLNRLVGEGLFERVEYCSAPRRFRYLLTEKGRDFVPVLLAMAAWGDKWFFEGKAPFRIVHKGCGHEVQAQVTCTECGEPLTAETVEPAASCCET